MEVLWFVLRLVAIIAAGYLIGNINFAILFSKLKKDDITKYGSGNPGAMNMTRTFGLGFGFLTFFTEAVKGASAAAIGYFVLGIDGLHMLGAMIAGVSAVFGQVWPVIYKFKGGKGVATTAGVFIFATFTNWWIGIIAFAAAWIVLCIVDYGAFAAIFFLTVLASYLLATYFGEIGIMCLILVAYFLVIYRHRENIRKMIQGKERKMQFAKRIARVFNKNVIIDDKVDKKKEPKKEEVEIEVEIDEEPKN